VEKFSLSLNHAAYMFNVFLLPKLELALRYTHGANTNGFVSNCDAAIIGCIKHAVASPLRLSHSAVALPLHINLPSWIEITTKVSEMFLRVNSTQCRWGRLGRILMRQTIPSGSADGSPEQLPHANSSRLARAARLAVEQLGWTLNLHQPTGGRAQHLFDLEPAGPLPDGRLCSISQDLQLSAGPIKVAHDLWQGWGATAPVPLGRVHVYTDGSYDAASVPHSTSAWAITVADQWFDSNYGGIPSDEQLLQAAHVKGATLFGANIKCTRGVYAAELQAIARALAMFPASCELEIHSDSRGALAGIHAYETQLNERRRLRMSARPLLQLIYHLLQRRVGDTHTSHVKAHSTNTDIHSVGNRLTDFQANLARAKPDTPAPLCLDELPLQKCEHHMFILDRHEQDIMLCDDIRRAALARLKCTSLARWMSRTDGRGDLAGPAMIELGQAVLRHGSAVQQTTLVHVATNSIEYFWPAGSIRNDQLQRLQCMQCNQVLSPAHLAECPESHCLQFRTRLAGDIRNTLAAEACTRDWLIVNSRLTLNDLLVSLFPIAATASEQEQLRHLTCLLVGAFTDRQATAAAKRLGFPSAEAGRSCFLQLRLLCLESIHRVYRSWKETAGA